MKITVHEFDHAFYFDLEAESLEDAARIARFAKNVKREFPAHGESVSKDGGFFQWLSFKKRQDATTDLGRK